MKSFFIISFLFLICAISFKAQTNTNIPGPENVLVVYNSNSDTSILIKNYYRDARNIPTSNIFGLNRLIDTLVYDSNSQTTHTIQIVQSGEIIKDANTQYQWTPAIHSWIYFNDRILKPIRNHLLTTYVNGTQLKDIIRFIVFCKGVPFRIQARQESGAGFRNNVPLDGLIAIIGETFLPNNEDAILNFYHPYVYQYFQ